MKRKIVSFLFISLLIPTWLFAATASHVVFFSASPYGTGDLKTVDPNDGYVDVTFLNSMAYLTVDQTGNIGSGDCIEYEDLIDPNINGKFYITPARLDFENGNTEIKIGDRIKCGTSEGYGTVRAVRVTSGSWVGNDAGGGIFFSKFSGSCLAGEALHRIKPTGVADIATTSYPLYGNMVDEFPVVQVDGNIVFDDELLYRVTSIHHEYASLDAADAGYTDANHINSTDLTDPNVDIVVHICGYYDHDDYTVDSTNLSIITTTSTDSDHFVYFYTPQGGVESVNDQRHDGKWNANKYIVETTSGNCIYNSAPISTFYGRVEGFQCHQDGDGGSCGISIVGFVSFYVSDNVIKASLSGGDNNCFGIYIGNSSTSCYFFNNIIYDFINGSKNNVGIRMEGYHPFVYNNTIYNCNLGVSNDSTNVYLIKNNIVKDTEDVNYSGLFSSSSTHNIGNSAASELAFGVTYTTGTTDGASANKLIDSDATLISDGVVIGCAIKNTTDTTYTYVTALDSEGQLSINDDIFASGENYSIYTNKYGDANFVDEAGDDFHLDSSDTLAIDLGTDLSSDATLPFWMDIDGYERSIYGDGWDIGADEAEESPNRRQIIFIEVARDSQCDICNTLDLCYGEGNLIDCLVL